MYAAVVAGLQIGGNGYKMKGDWITKGCYAMDTGDNAGMAWFGTGGTFE